MNPKPWLAFTMSLCQLPEAAETTVLGGWVSSDHLLDMSPFWTRPCLAVPSLFLHLSPCQLFSDVAYKARNREDLIAGIDEFLDEVIVLPPGEWDPNIRIEPPKKVPSADKRCV